MKSLITKSTVILFTILLVSCGQQTDKNAQLDKMKLQYSELGEKIKQLETELNIPAQVKEEKSVSVEVSKTTISEFNHYVEIQGRVDGENNVAIMPQMPGIVTHLFVKEGSNVKKGQILAQLDDNVIKQQVIAIKQQVDFATSLYEKQKNLWEKEIGSEVQYLSAKNQKEAMEKNLLTLNEQLEMYKIKSPINGTVEEVGLKIGQMAAAGILPAFRVVNFSSVKVVADVAEAYAPRIKSGSNAVVYFPDYNVEIPSKLNFSSKFINPTNRTFLVEIKLGKSEVEYRANMLAIIKIVDYSNPSAVILPVNLIKDSNEGTYVFVSNSEGGKTIARKRIIKTGQNYNGFTEVIEGLTENENVISKGQNDLIDGQLISVLN